MLYTKPLDFRNILYKIIVFVNFKIASKTGDLGHCITSLSINKLKPWFQINIMPIIPHKNNILAFYLMINLEKLFAKCKKFCLIEKPFTMTHFCI